MNVAILSWYRGRTPRERVLIGAAASLALLLFAWIALVSPLRDAMGAAHIRYEAAVSRLGAARAEAAQRRLPVRQNRRRRLDMPADSLLARAAADAGFVNARVASTGAGSTRLTIEAARAQPFLAMLRQLEESGLLVLSLRARPNADRTIRVEATFAGMPS